LNEHLRFSFPDKTNLFSLKVPSGSERDENGNGLPGALSLMNMEPHCARGKGAAPVLKSSFEFPPYE